MKKLLSLVLAISAFTTMTAFANSEEIILISQNPATEITETIQAPEYLTSYGEIKEVGEDFVLVDTINDEEIRFNTSEFTKILDADKVLPLDLAQRETNNVMVTYSTAMTKSIPPQSYAYAIVGNIKAETGNPIFTIVEDVKSTDDGIVIVTENDTKEITVPKTAAVSPYLTKNIVTVNDIKKGSNVLLWYDVMTLSIPAYAASERVVLFEDSVFDIYGEIEKENTVSVNGVEITLRDGEIVYDNNGTEMLPLRTVAEALGFKVEWLEETQSIIVSGNAAFNATVRIGEKGFGISKARFMFDVAPFLYNGNTTYVPSSFFAELPENN